MSINTHDDLLVQAAIDGDRTALAQLLLTYYDELERHVAARISRQLQGLERPEDILQQTFVRAAQAISAFTPQHAGAFRGWLKTIADNLLRDAEKRRRREPRCVPGHGESQSGLLNGVPTDLTSPSVRARRAERVDRLRRAMSQLAPDQRDVLHRRYLRGQSPQQIALETGRTVSAVRGLCYRARANLHAVMGNTSLYFSSLFWRTAQFASSLCRPRHQCMGPPRLTATNAFAGSCARICDSPRPNRSFRTRSLRRATRNCNRN